MDNDLKESLKGNREAGGEAPLNEDELQEQIESLRPYLRMVNEMGRFALLQALGSGKIDVETFKSRALRKRSQGGEALIVD